MNKRIEKIKSKLDELSVDALLITSEVNQRYVTGLSFTDGYVLVTNKSSYLVTDFRYIEVAKSICGNEFIVSMPSNMIDFIADIVSAENIKTVLFEENTISYSQLEMFKKRITSDLISGASEIIDSLRLYKDEDEISYMKQAQTIADKALNTVLKMIKPSMTEIDVALELEYQMRKNGAEAIAFETIAVSGTASSRPHGVPRNCILEKGFLTMDFGCKINGYCSDMTRTVVIGNADNKIKKVYNTVLNAHLKALEFVKAGAHCLEVDKIARDIIENAGYKGCFGHGLGHGVGLYIHEKPNLSPKQHPDNILEVGNTVTIEPGIYIEGLYGCRIEDTIICLEDGKIFDFTESPKELIEII